MWGRLHEPAVHDEQALVPYRKRNSVCIGKLHVPVERLDSTDGATDALARVVNVRTRTRTPKEPRGCEG